MFSLLNLARVNYVVAQFFCLRTYYSDQPVLTWLQATESEAEFSLPRESKRHKEIIQFIEFWNFSVRKWFAFDLFGIGFL